MRFTRGAWRLLLIVPVIAVAIAMIVWRGPDWHLVRHAFTSVSWPWVFGAIGLNLLSVITRAFAWDTAIKQSIVPPHPAFRLVFSAFSVGLFANAVLPGRVGELARVAVLRRRLDRHPKGTSATLIGSVFAHRMFDLFPSVTLVVWVYFAAKIPGWAKTGIAAALAVGVVLFFGAWALARMQHRLQQGIGTLRLLVARGREGLAIMRAPVPAATAATAQFAGWTCQLFAVWATMHAFAIDKPLSAAGLVLVLINVATVFPLWPGNVGLVQIAIATPLVSYGVAYAHGVAFGIGLQAIEASVGIGVGVVFLTREGLSYASLKSMEQEEEHEEEARQARGGAAGEQPETLPERVHL